VDDGPSVKIHILRRLEKFEKKIHNFNERNILGKFKKNGGLLRIYEP